MRSAKTPAKTEKKLTVRSLRIFTGVRAGEFREPVVIDTGKKKNIVPSDVG